MDRLISLPLPDDVPLSFILIGQHSNNTALVPRIQRYVLHMDACCVVHHSPLDEHCVTTNGPSCTFNLHSACETCLTSNGTNASSNTQRLCIMDRADIDPNPPADLGLTNQTTRYARHK